MKQLEYQKINPLSTSVLISQKRVYNIGQDTELTVQLIVDSELMLKSEQHANKTLSFKNCPN